MDYFDPLSRPFWTVVGVALLESSVKWLTLGVHKRRED